MSFSLWYTLISDGRKIGININRSLQPEIAGYKVVRGPDGVFHGEINEGRSNQIGFPLADEILNTSVRISPGISVDNLQLSGEQSSNQNANINLAAVATDMQKQGLFSPKFAIFVKPELSLNPSLPE